MNVTEQFKSKLAVAGQSVEFDGFPLRLRYVPIEIWIEAGRVPQFISTSYLRALGGDLSSAGGAGLSEEETLDYLRFKRAVIEYAALEPPISFAAQAPEGAISAEEIAAAAPGLLEFIFNFATFQARESKVQTAEGEVSATALNNFHADGAGPEKFAGFVVHSADVQSEAVGAAAAV